MIITLKKSIGLKGSITIPGDKSISHRAIMFGSIANGLTEITNFLHGADCLSTIACFRSLGVSIEQQAESILIRGKGLHSLLPPANTLDVGNSGTTIRLLAGLLAGQTFPCVLTGDASIQKRPMGRIVSPLSQMGANIASLVANDTAKGDLAPLRICPAKLKGIHYHSPVASAQVKSAVLLAGLYAEGKTSVTEPSLSRNHSEIMLSHFGANIQTKSERSVVTHHDTKPERPVATHHDTKPTVSIQPHPVLNARKIHVPGDISSAAYFIAAALLVPNSEVLIQNVGINPTRDGILKVAKAMGANITLSNQNNDSGEPTADLLVRSTPLLATTIGGDIIPTLIDELPVIAVMASLAKGTTIIKDAAELKVKESNRIDRMVQNLSAMNADIHATEDGMIIHGVSSLVGAKTNAAADHRIAMSMAVAALVADGETIIADGECVDISYPSFYQDLKKLMQ